jgi:hypothetical protein
MVLHFPISHYNSEDPLHRGSLLHCSHFSLLKHCNWIFPFHTVPHGIRFTGMVAFTPHTTERTPGRAPRNDRRSAGAAEGRGKEVEEIQNWGVICELQKAAEGEEEFLWKSSFGNQASDPSLWSVGSRSSRRWEKKKNSGNLGNALLTQTYRESPYSLG